MTWKSIGLSSRLRSSIISRIRKAIGRSEELLKTFAADTVYRIVMHLENANNEFANANEIMNFRSRSSNVCSIRLQLASKIFLTKNFTLRVSLQCNRIGKIY